MADHFFVPILSMQLQTVLLYVVAIFVGFTGVFGFLSGQSFTYALVPELRYPKEGSEKNDESRAFGLALTLVYLLALGIFVFIKLNS